MLTAGDLIPVLQNYFRQTVFERVYLVGSVARNTAEIDSDIDLLVSFKHGSVPTIFDLIEAKQDIEDLTGHGVDIIQEGTAYPHIVDSIERDKILVYG